MVLRAATVARLTLIVLRCASSYRDDVALLPTQHTALWKHDFGFNEFRLWHFFKILECFNMRYISDISYARIRHAYRGSVSIFGHISSRQFNAILPTRSFELDIASRVKSAKHPTWTCRIDVMLEALYHEMHLI